MATSKRVRSLKSGRLTGTSEHDSGWLLPALDELRNIPAIAVRDHGEEFYKEAEHAILWSGNWLVAYDAGQCKLIELLDATRRVAKRLPGMLPRLLLGVIAHKALLTTPRRLGEQKSRTKPHLVRCIGGQVNGFLFDDSGIQLCTVDRAVCQVRHFLLERELFSKTPSEAEIKQWFLDWRKQEIDSGKDVPTPKKGRPKK